MEIKEFVKYLNDLHFSLRVRNGNLVLSGDKTKLTKQDILDVQNNHKITNYIKNNKSLLIEYLIETQKNSKKIESISKLSPLQEGILFHGLYDNQSGANIDQLSIEIKSPNLVSINYCWQLLIEKYEILRTGFHFDAFNIPVQCVYREAKMPFRIIDLQKKRISEQTNVINKFLEEDRKEGFDFKKAPLMRITIFKLNINKYKMIWTSHHILMDGWSLSIIMKSFLVLYENVQNNKTIQLGEIDSFQNYIKYIESRDKDKLELHWKNYLKDVTEPTLLPFAKTSYERTKGIGVYKKISISIKNDKTNKIKIFAQKNHITLNTVIQGIWAFLLSYYTNNNNVVFGITVSGRPEEIPNVNSKVGAYINMIPLFTKIFKNLGIKEWLIQIQKEQVDNIEHQYISLSTIQKLTGINYDLFDTALTFQNYPISKEITNNKWQFEVTEITTYEQPNFPLNISVNSSTNINAVFTYNNNIFDDIYVSQISNHFKILLTDIAEEGNKKILNLYNIVANDIKANIIKKVNEYGNYGNDTLISCFNKQVANQPDKTALIYGDKNITYGQLDEQATKLAIYIIKQQLKDNKFIPIYVERSVLTIIAIIGVLKSGAAYVPIDVDYPEERVLYILNDIKANIIVTSRQSNPIINNITNIPTVLLDELEDISVEKSSDILNANYQPEDLAYVMYTSGSTGHPKGVMVENKSVINLIRSQEVEFSINSEDIILQFSNFTFDASVEQIWLALFNGASLVLLNKSALLEYASIEKIINDKNITHLHVTPSFLKNLDPAFQYKKLKRVIVGGETCPVSLAKSWGKNYDFYNEYGPTEVTVTSTLYKYTSKIDLEDSIPIGKAIKNLFVTIVDSELNPLPIGIPGEILISGIGVAKGYINQQNLTEKSFFYDANNYWSYKTGDIGYWLPNENIAFVGRNDNQVKVRGYRVEPEEIEKYIDNQNQVYQCCVVLKKNNKEERLTCYYIPSKVELQKKEDKYYLNKINKWCEIRDKQFHNNFISLDENNINDDLSYISIEKNVMINEKKEYLDDIVKIILNDNTKSVLEIGCGTGHIFFEIANKINYYVGTDCSKKSISNLLLKVKAKNNKYPEYIFKFGNTHEIFSTLNKKFDTIILNSITQYFPGEQYLNSIIINCVNVLNENGRIIVYNVQDLRALKLLKYKLYLQTEHNQKNTKDFEWFISQEVMREQELWISPDYFIQLPSQIQKINHVEIQLNQSDYTNKLSSFNYTVILYINDRMKALKPKWRPYQKGIFLEHDLFKQKKGNIQNAICGLPNPTMWKEKQIHNILLNNQIKDLRDIETYNTRIDDESIKIYDVILTAKANGYYIYFFPNTNLFKIDLLITKRPLKDGITNTYSIEKGNEYTNIPIMIDIYQEMHNTIRNNLSAHLPHYMIPTNYECTSYLPLTITGKIDRKFLSKCTDINERKSTNYKAPTNDLEVIISHVWKEVLALEHLSIDDNFFEIGGHSLLAIRTISILSKKIQTQISIKDLFDNPTVSKLSSYLNEIKGEHNSLYITKQSRPKLVPLSFSQERLWLIDQIEGSISYHVTEVIELDSDLNVIALSKSLNYIVNRHEVLRTIFKTDNGIPYQFILPKDKWNLDVTDLTSETININNNELIQKISLAPFDLSKDHMLRAHLLSRGNQGFLLILSIHHIATDGLSTNIIINELTTLYNAYDNGIQANLKPLTIQYADYAIWERLHFNEDTLIEKQTYWKNQLDNIEEIQFNFNKITPGASNNESVEGGTYSFNIPSSISNMIQKISIEHNATLFISMLASIKILLFRYTNHNDITIGTPISGRKYVELENLVGCFINTLVLRNNISGSDSFFNILRQVRKNTLDAFDNQDMPFEKIVELFTDDRNSNNNKLFQIMFVMHNTTEIPSLELGNVKLQQIAYEPSVTKFDLTFSIIETSNGLHMSIHYKTNKFDENVIKRMGENFLVLLKELINNPDLPINILEFITIEERNKLLYSFNNKPKPYDRDITFIELFNNQVLNKPHLISLVYGKSQFTYKELDILSNQLANYLTRISLAINKNIIVIFDNCPDVIICMLSILKINAAFIPVDPSLPISRINHIIDDISPEIILSNSELLSTLPNSQSIVKIPLDLDWQIISNEEKTFREIKHNINHPMYIIYTSGSTGVPKGVIVSNRSVTNYLNWFNEKAKIKSEDKTVLLTSFTFDLGYTAVFSALSSGAELHILDKDYFLSPDALTDYIFNNKITYLKLTPSIHSIMMNGRSIIDALNKIRLIISGGESINLNTLVTTFEINKNISIINHFGPTETTIGCITYDIKDDNAFTLKHNNIIGNPINNVNAYILDDHMQLVPIGVPGELYVGGYGLSSGYVNFPSLTDKKFVKSPFNSDEKLYKTGDYVNRLENGDIVFLGRLDNQVKIRGYRVEIDEVTNTLLRHPEVKDCITSTKIFNSDIYLFAYIVTKIEVKTEDIRLWLFDKLPIYMIPSSIILIDKIPLTNNGKINYKALPFPALELETVHTTPHGMYEENVAVLFSKVLEIPLKIVSANSNFFALGGHSLKAVILASEIRNFFELDFSVRDVFILLTVNKIAERLIQLNSNQEEELLRELEQMSSKDIDDLLKN